MTTTTGTPGPAEPPETTPASTPSRTPASVQMTDPAPFKLNEDAARAWLADLDWPVIGEEFAPRKGDGPQDCSRLLLQAMNEPGVIERPTGWDLTMDCDGDDEDFCEWFVWLSAPVPGQREGRHLTVWAGACEGNELASQEDRGIAAAVKVLAESVAFGNDAVFKLREFAKVWPVTAPPARPVLLANLATSWRTASAEAEARAGEQPASFSEVSDDALADAYAECARDLDSVGAGMVLVPAVEHTALRADRVAVDHLAALLWTATTWDGADVLQSAGEISRKVRPYSSGSRSTRNYRTTFRAATGRELPEHYATPLEC